MQTRSNIVLLLFILLLSSCSQPYFHTRKYSGRDYIRIGLHEMPADEVMVKHNSSQNLSSQQTKEWPVSGIMDTVYTTSSPSTLPDHFIHSRKLTNRQAIKTGSPYRKPATKKHDGIPKATKTANQSSALNIIGLSAAILALVGFFAAGIILLFALLSATLLVPGITLLWICFGLALVGMILGALGVGLKHPGKGMGIAALVIGSIILFSVFLIVILIAVL